MRIFNDAQMNQMYRFLIVAITLSILFNLNKTMAQTTPETTAKNKEEIRKGFERWHTGTGSFFDLLDENMTWTITGSTPYSKTYNGKKALMDEVINPLNQRLSKKIVPTVRNIYADGDTVIAIWDGEATAKDGKPYLGTYSWSMQLDKGKIIKVVAFLDGIAFTDIMERLPATP